MDDFFDTSCRVCLEASDTMLNTDEKIHKFNKTINELLIESVNFEVRIALKQHYSFDFL